MGVHPGILNDRDLMAIALFCQSGITRPAIRMDQTTRRNRGGDEIQQAFSASIRDTPHSDTSDPLAVHLRCDCNQRLLKGLPSFYAFFQASEIRFIHLNFTAQIRAPRCDHRMADFVQPSPCGFIASQAKDSLQSQGAGTVLLGHYPPNSPEEKRQRGTHSLENGPRRNAGLVMTSSARQKTVTFLPNDAMGATRTDKTLRPTQ